MHLNQLNNVAGGPAHIETLQNEKFSKGNLMNLDLINLIVESGNLSILSDARLFLFNRQNPIVVVLAPEIDEVNGINLQVTQRVQRA